jgi:hypothetical protein
MTELWDAVYTLVDRNDALAFRVEDRIRIGKGFGRVVASLPDGQRMTALETVSLPIIRRLDHLTLTARDTRDVDRLSRILIEVGAEIRILSAFARSFVNVTSEWGREREDDDDDDAAVEYLDCEMQSSPVPELVHRVIEKAWPSITQVTENWADDEVRRFGKEFVESFSDLTCQPLIMRRM